MSVARVRDMALAVIALTYVPPALVIAVVALDVPIAVMAGLVAGVFEHNRVCEVLGLFVLLLVGIMLTSKAGHSVFFDCEVDRMSGAIFYFVPFTATLTDVVHRRRQCEIRTVVAIRSVDYVAAAR